jgi:hypothetical protein
MKTDVCRLALLFAYEAGRWRGQVDLEEYYDQEQFSTAAMESFESRKTAMPMLPESIGRTVTVNLRSQEWREGVERSAQEHVEKAFELLKPIIQQNFFEFDGEKQITGK